MAENFFKVEDELYRVSSIGGPLVCASDAVFRKY